MLRSSGIERAYVDGSGDIAVGMPPPGKANWRIEIAALREAEDSDPVSIEIANCAVATSGDAFQAAEISGRLYSHIVDPRTGTPLSTPSSVTIIAPNGMQADSLASAVSVMGPGKGTEMIGKLKQAECFVVTFKEGRSVVKATSGFRSLTVNEAAPESFYR